MNLSGINEINKREAYRYMGFRSSTPPDSFIAITLECEKKLLKVAKPKMVYRVFEAEDFTDDGVKLKGSSLFLKGQNIKKLLGGCRHAGIFAATLGVGVDTLIRQLEAADITSGFIADNLASALIEQVCDQTEKEIANALGNVTLTTRFSCGYGDLPLESQGEFLKAVDATKEIGICMTDTLIMIPRKSVTAVMGIKDYGF